MPLRILENKVVVVAGARSALNCTIVRRFVQSGANVSFGYADPGSSDETTSALADIDGVRMVSCDLNQVLDIQNLVKDVLGEHEAIDILVGVLPAIPRSRLDTMTPECFSSRLLRSLSSLHMLAHTALHHWLRGQDVPIASDRAPHSLVAIAPPHAIPDKAPVTETDPIAGLQADFMSVLVRHLGHALGPHGVRVNGVVPGRLTQTSPANASPMPQEAEEASIRAKPVEIADIAVFLASSLSRCINGEVIRAAGERPDVRDVEP